MKFCFLDFPFTRPYFSSHIKNFLSCQSLIKSSTFSFYHFSKFSIFQNNNFLKHKHLFLFIIFLNNSFSILNQVINIYPVSHLQLFILSRFLFFMPCIPQRVPFSWSNHKKVLLTKVVFCSNGSKGAFNIFVYERDFVQTAQFYFFCWWSLVELKHCAP